MVLKSYAKINLILKVFPPRRDGYHPIWSIFQRIHLYDTLTITPIPEKKIILTCNNPTIPVDSNTLTKVYQVVASQLSTGFAIHLEKTIPTGAGLGGGSSNAATFLHYLHTTQTLPLTPALTHTIAQNVGADIPFFLGPSTALVTGIGEIVTPVTLTIPPYIGVCFPNIHSDTKAAYTLLDTTRSPITSATDPKTASASIPPIEHCESHFGENDFADCLFKHHPQLNAINEMLRKHSLSPFFLSGSGSSLYWLFQSKTSLQEWKTTMRRLFPTFQIWATHPV